MKSVIIARILQETGLKNTTKMNKISETESF